VRDYPMSELTLLPLPRRPRQRQQGQFGHRIVAHSCRDRCSLNCAPQ